ESWKNSLEVAYEIDQRFELAGTYLEMGLRLQDRSYLEAAEEILTEIGAMGHLAKLARAGYSF
ncbi:MAG: hypothetical protein R3293_21070, partial [Candidatus Promineifilaceae bacterium]|nr:hypothetical protein [Candidatus Promineifilaceae bacterium]